MELILTLNAAISIVLLAVHLADYFAGRSSLPLANTAKTRAVEPALGTATQAPNLIEEYDRAA